MALHTDIPTRTEIERLLSTREPWCVTIYLPTTPVTPEAQGDHIALKNHVADAVHQLQEAGAPKDAVAAIEEEILHLVEDYAFWNTQAYSLAVFATPERIHTFRLPNHLSEAVQVADRFFVKPLLRAVSFPQAAFVLALSQNHVRLLEVSADAPAEVLHVAELPKDLGSAVGHEGSTDNGGRGSRVQNAEGQKVRMRQYSRAVDHAIRSVLAGKDLPLILAAAQPLDSIFRSVCSYPHLAEPGISGNPEVATEEELAASTRAILDELYAAELSELRDRFEMRAAQGRGATDVVDVARAATFGAVDTVLVDIDAELTGAIDEASGVVTYGADGVRDYGVIDEIARRVLLTHGKVLAVRADDIPGGGPTAAILRYPV